MIDRYEADQVEGMVRAVMSGPPIYWPAPFWRELAVRHMRMLEEHGPFNFKRTVNLQYFNWAVVGILRYQLMGVLKAWLQQPDPKVFRSRIADAFGDQTGSHLLRFNRASAWLYRTYVSMFASVLARRDPRRLLELGEPKLGNPVVVQYSGLPISQDLCNSIDEFYRVIDHLPIGGSHGPLVAELGAGYGRLAFVFLRALPGVKYCIVDIPPALYLAQWYLTRVLPTVPAFRFREFGSFAEIREQFRAARLMFLAPHQIELLPADIFDCFINISSLHEMSLDQIRHYFAQIDRLTSGVFYTKQWRVSYVPSNGSVISERDYPVPGHWRVLFQRRHAIHRRFFEAMYRIPTSR